MENTIAARFVFTNYPETAEDDDDDEDEKD